MLKELNQKSYSAPTQLPECRDCRLTQKLKAAESGKESMLSADVKAKFTRELNPFVQVRSSFLDESVLFAAGEVSSIDESLPFADERCTYCLSRNPVGEEEGGFTNGKAIVFADKPPRG